MSNIGHFVLEIQDKWASVIFPSGFLGHFYPVGKRRWFTPANKMCLRQYAQDSLDQCPVPIKILTLIRNTAQYRKNAYQCFAILLNWEVLSIIDGNWPSLGINRWVLYDTEYQQLSDWPHTALKQYLNPTIWCKVRILQNRKKLFLSFCLHFCTCKSNLSLWTVDKPNVRWVQT